MTLNPNEKGAAEPPLFRVLILPWLCLSLRSVLGQGFFKFLQSPAFFFGVISPWDA